MVAICGSRPFSRSYIVPGVIFSDNKSSKDKSGSCAEKRINIKHMKIIKQAIRTLSKFRLYFTINLLGLVLSLTCGMILLRYVHQELTVDHYINDLDRVFLTVREFQNQPTQLSGIIDRNNDPNHVNIIDASVESYSSFKILIVEIIEDDSRYAVNAFAVDSTFLDIFSYQLKAGSMKFRSPNDAIITDRLAERLFGKDNPIGKTFTYGGTKDILTVTGVLKEPKTKKSISFDLLVPIDYKKQESFSDFSIIKLFPGVDFKEFNKKYSDFVSLRGFLNTPSRLQLFQLKNFYLDSTVPVFGNGISLKGNIKNIVLLAMILVLLFIIGFFNYSNLYTVLILNRAREFGVKKVYGANGKYVFGQIWMENILLTIIALFVVWTVIELTGEIMESLFSIPMKSNLLFDLYISLFVLFIFPILVSFHPAIKYNHAPPIISLRSVSITGKSVVSRIAFLLFQYVITFFILVVSLFFMKQLHYMLNMDLAYRTNDIIRFTFQSEDRMPDFNSEEQIEKKGNARDLQQVIQQKFNESILIEKWARGNYLHSLTPSRAFKSENGEYKKAAIAGLSEDFIDLFDIQLLEGRLWDSDQDETFQYKMIINETAKKYYDIKDISKEFIQPEGRLWITPLVKREEFNISPAYEIVGVIKDFKTNHLSHENVPLIILYSNDNSPYSPYIVTFSPDKKEATIKFLNDIYDELVGEGVFEYSLLEDEIAALYKEDKQVSIIYITFAIVAILISCLGLFGLSLFDIRQRYREIALRKINGASVKDIISLLLKKYTYILAISFLIAVPISYFVINRYLEGFAHKAPVSWWLFVAAGVLVGAISYMTLYFQIKRAVRINPSVVLKSE